jgi:hypothetical protein
LNSGRKDNWTDTDMPLINYTVSPIQHFEATKVVANYVDSSVGWDLSNLINKLPSNIIDDIKRLPPPILKVVMTVLLGGL